jgi:hypothetical protein
VTTSVDDLPDKVSDRDDEDSAERVTGGGFPELRDERIEPLSGQLTVQNGGGHPVFSPEERLGVDGG